ncbi:HNH endonuclease signature motif containing protein [Leucobacter chromiireducens]|uniref:HNH endonuclease n=1 Tax=Leucobacter chromiireducens subsp. solipictus TaxID=398235 RepID=A0ABS1SFY9_9MICO|nr:HNH endonuclease signature motif containing protein [Leucobacter chromiireducens]MBL3679326.1 HNH endonuclease [Leucobacter chromiireducens subsp. solipictus]
MTFTGDTQHPEPLPGAGSGASFGSMVPPRIVRVDALLTSLEAWEQEQRRRDAERLSILADLHEAALGADAGAESDTGEGTGSGAVGTGSSAAGIGTGAGAGAGAEANADASASASTDIDAGASVDPGASLDVDAPADTEAAASAGAGANSNAEGTPGDANLPDTHPAGSTPDETKAPTPCTSPQSQAQLRVSPAFQGKNSELAFRSLRAMVAMACHTSEHVAARDLDLAYETRHTLPATLDALRAGTIALPHARIVVDEGAIFHTLTTPNPDTPDALTVEEQLEDLARRRTLYEQDAIRYAEKETPNRFRPIARRLAAMYAKKTLAERHREALKRRHVRVVELDDGMAELRAVLPAEEAYEIYDRLTRLAKHVHDRPTEHPVGRSAAHPAAHPAEPATNHTGPGTGAGETSDTDTQGKAGGGEAVRVPVDPDTVNTTCPAGAADPSKSDGLSSTVPGTSPQKSSGAPHSSPGTTGSTGDAWSGGDAGSTAGTKGVQGTENDTSTSDSTSTDIDVDVDVDTNSGAEGADSDAVDAAAVDVDATHDDAQTRLGTPTESAESAENTPGNTTTNTVTGTNTNTNTNAELDTTIEASTQDPTPADRSDATPDARSRDELRADILTDLLTGKHHDDYTGIHGRIQTITPGSLLGIPGIPLPDTTPIQGTVTAAPVAELVGYGPIDLDTAARIAGEAIRWEEIRVTLDGQVMSTNTYTPTQAQRRYLAARDQHCRTPGCRVPAHRCDIDHTIDAAHGGPTRVDNLAHLCRNHHVMKHHTGWTLTQHDAGEVSWKDPTGRTYQDRAPSRVRFVPVIEPPNDDTRESPGQVEGSSEHPF